MLFFPSHFHQDMAGNYFKSLGKGLLLIFLILGLSSHGLAEIKSMANNTGNTDIKGYLLMKVEYWDSDSGSWQHIETIVNDSSPRKVSFSQPLALDIIWENAGAWKTEEVKDGTYRIYVALRNPEGKVLNNQDNSTMESSYNFTVDTGPPTITFSKPSLDNSTLVAKWFQQNITVSDRSLVKLNCTIYNSSRSVMWSKAWNLTGSTVYQVKGIIDVSNWSFDLYYENCTAWDASQK